MSGGRLPKRIMLGNLEGAIRRGRGRKEKEWTNCVQSDIRAGKGRRWRQGCGLRQSRRVGGGLLWPRRGKKRQTRLDFAKRRDRQRDWENCYRTRKRRTCEATPIWLVDGSKESCTGARCSTFACMHIYASRDALSGHLLFCSLRCKRLNLIMITCFFFYLSIFYFLSTSSVRGGGCCQTSSFCCIFRVQKTTTSSGIGHRVK